MKNYILVLFIILLVGCSTDTGERPYSSIGAPTTISEADIILSKKIDKKFGDGTVDKYIKEAKSDLFNDENGPLSNLVCGIRDYANNGETATLSIDCCRGTGRASFCRGVDYKIENSNISNTNTTENNNNGELFSEEKSSIDKSNNIIKINDYVKFRDYIRKVIGISEEDVILEGYNQNIKKTEVRKLNDDELKMYIQE